MNIQAATQKALESGGRITRRLWNGSFHIRPTDGPDCCICYAEGKRCAPRWNPYAEDLVADDWEVTGITP